MQGTRAHNDMELFITMLLWFCGPATVIPRLLQEPENEASIYLVASTCS